MGWCASVQHAEVNLVGDVTRVWRTPTLFLPISRAHRSDIPMQFRETANLCVSTIRGA